MAKNTVLGLDIGSASMKAVCFSQTPDGNYLLSAAYNTPAPEKGMQSDSTLDQEEMADSLRKMVKEAQIATPYVHVALSESQVYTRVIEMPILSEKELASAIYWEAEQYIPVPLSEITFDYVVIKKPERPDANSKMRVLLVGAATQLINKYKNIISLAGLSLVSLETEILSVVRLLRHIHRDEVLTGIVVNIGASTASFVILNDAEMTFTYSVPLGGIAVTRAIATGFGFALTQAEEYKKTYGISQTNLEGKIARAAEPVLSAIVSEIKRAAAFYAEKHPNEEPLRHIILSGGSAKLIGLEAYFVKQCGMDTSVVNPWSIVQSQQLPPELLANAPEYSVAVGLAMKEL